MEFEGIVIRRITYKEGAAMITVLTENHIKSFLAKGVLKMTSKNAPSVNLFTKSRFQVFHGQDGDWLRVGEIIESFPHINDCLEKLAILDFISELTNNLIEDEVVYRVYPLLENSLRLLNTDFSPWTVLAVYFAHIIEIAGYGLCIDRCAKCGNPHGIVSLSFIDGGFICEKCFDEKVHTKTDVRKMKMLRYITRIDPDLIDKVTFGKDECKELIFELCNFLDWTSQITFKSLTLLSQI